MAFCEIDPYCRAVLRKHWPGVPIYDDVRGLTANRLAADGIGRIDVVTGGFPCQPFSVAGKRAGTDDERHLWPELARIVREVRPRWVVAENVPGLLSGGYGRWFGEVLRDLAAIGYDAEWYCIPACAVGAPHIRDRVWIIASPNADSGRQQEQPQRDGRTQTGKQASFGRDVERSCVAYPARYVRAEQAQSGAERERTWPIREPILVAYSNGSGFDQGLGSEQESGTRSELANGGWWLTEPDVGRVADGIPRRVDRLRSLGNSVVPQIPQLIGEAILNCEQRKED